MSLLRVLGFRRSSTSYSVNRDGALVLDTAAMLRSGRFKAQFEAARQLAEEARRTAPAAAPSPQICCTCGRARR